MSSRTSNHRAIRNLGRLARAALASFGLCATLLVADWSSPEIIYPSSSPYTATNPSIATDASGNCVAVWVDTHGSGSLRAARIATTVNTTGFGNASWILTDPISSSNVQTPSDFAAPMVAMDSSGNSTAAWTDGTYVYTSTLELNGSSWSSPITINNPIGEQVVYGVYIASAENGTVGVTWNSSVYPYDVSVMTNMRIDGTWLGQIHLLNNHVEFNSSCNPIALDPVGNGIILLTQTSNNTQAVSFDVNQRVWTTIPSAAATQVFGSSGVMDSNGNSTIVWIEQDYSIYAATLPYNTYTLNNVTLLSSSVQSDFFFPMTAVDGSGNAVALWLDAFGYLVSATYSMNTGQWNIRPLLSLEGNSCGDLSLSEDADGNSVVSWTVFGDATSYIQATAFREGNLIWNTPITVSSPTDRDNSSHIILTETGHAILVWENDITDDNFGTINSSIFANVLASIHTSDTPYDILKIKAIYEQANLETEEKLMKSGLLFVDQPSRDYPEG